MADRSTSVAARALIFRATGAALPARVARTDRGTTASRRRRRAAAAAWRMARRTCRRGWLGSARPWPWRSPHASGTKRASAPVELRSRAKRQLRRARVTRDNGGLPPPLSRSNLGLHEQVEVREARAGDVRLAHQAQAVVAQRQVLHHHEDVFEELSEH